MKLNRVQHPQERLVAGIRYEKTTMQKVGFPAVKMEKRSTVPLTSIQHKTWVILRTQCLCMCSVIA